ncbi:MAG TPA: hypothetical protein VGB98_08750 [Pyrinomonadaceae bacterium]
MQQERAFDGLGGAARQLLVRAVQGVSCLEGDDVPAAEHRQPLAHLRGGQAQVTEVVVARKVEDAQRPRDAEVAPRVRLRDERVAWSVVP